MVMMMTMMKKKSWQAGFLSFSLYPLPLSDSIMYNEFSEPKRCRYEVM